MCFETTVHANSANVEVRAEGAGVFAPDTINGHQKMIASGFPVKFTVSVETDFLASTSNIGFRLYSPDGSISDVSHIAVDSFTAWITPWDLVPVQYVFFDGDGLLPDTFATGGVSFNGGFGPTELVDIFALIMSFPADASGVFCIDSTYFPPAGPWLFTNGAPVVPTWGANSGGYPSGGYCVTLASDLTCCSIPGDADGIQGPNIADVIFIIRYIFQSAADPVCLAQADANGDGQITIGDPLYIIRYILIIGAPAPVCGPPQ